MDAAKLAEIEARANAATPGPWREGNTGSDDPAWVEVDTGEDGDEIGLAQVIDGPRKIARTGWSWLKSDQQHRTNAAFIAAARTDVPALVAEVRRLTAALDAARREGAEEMREALIVRFTQRVEYLHPWAEAEDDENGCHTGAWTEALNAVQFTRDMVLPLDAPGGAT